MTTTPNTELKAIVDAHLKRAFAEAARKGGLRQVKDWVALIENGKWVGDTSGILEKLKAAPQEAWVDGENHVELELLFGNGNGGRTVSFLEQ